MNYGKRKLSSIHTDSASHVDTDSNINDADDTVRRKFRNLTEKKRRDQFNMLITELSNIVCSSCKKPDKTKVLLETIAFLKHQKASQSTQEKETNCTDGWRPSFLATDELASLLMEAIDSFLLVLSREGVIQCVSDSTTSMLGQSKGTLVGKDIREILHKNNQSLLEEMQNCLSNNRCLPDSSTWIYLRLPRSSSPLNGFGEEAFVIAKVLGVCLVPPGATDPTADDNNLDAVQDKSCDNHALVVKVIGRNPIKEFYGSSSLQFVTRHSMEWKILHVEQRVSYFIGFQHFEMLGTSGYDYYHPADLQKIVREHKQLMKTGCCTSACYRHRTKSNDWVWLQSSYYISYNQWNAKPEFVQGTHCLASIEDVLCKPFVDAKTDAKLASAKFSATSADTHSMEEQPRPRDSVTRAEEKSKYASSSDSTNAANRRDVYSCLGEMVVKHSMELLKSQAAAQTHMSAALGVVPPTHQHQQRQQHQQQQQQQSPMSAATSDRISQLTPVQRHLHEQLLSKYYMLQQMMQVQQQELQEVFQHLVKASPVAVDDSGDSGQGSFSYDPYANSSSSSFIGKPSFST